MAAPSHDEPREPNQALGPLRQAWWSRARDPDIAGAGQYGGTVSALLLAQLRADRAQVALTAGPPRSRVFPLLPSPRWVRTREELLASAGTRYVARPGMAAVNRWLAADTDRAALVGRPCELAGLARRLALQPELAPRIGLRIGLFCMWSLDHDRLAALLGDLASAVLTMEADPQWLRLRLDGGEERRLPIAEVRPLARQACRRCADFSAESADVSVGSTECDVRWNSLLVRSAAGQAAVEDAQRQGLLQLRPFPPERLALLRAAAADKRSRAQVAGLAKEAGHALG